MDTPQDPPQLRQLLSAAQAQGLDRLEAQLVLLHALGRSGAQRAWLLAHDTDTAPAVCQAVFLRGVLRRLAGEPLAYITGQQAFYGLDLVVDARVLVPRPDTETLVDWALEVLIHTPRAAVLDLGTGSGAIALALKATRPDLHLHAVDFSHDALAVALVNAQRLNLVVDFSQGSWLAGVTGRFHAIVSNPPYIADQDQHLAALTHEPLQALASGADGLDDIRTLITQAPAHLLPGGWLLLEHGYDQAPAVRNLLEAAGFAEVQSRRDLAGVERCSGGRAL
ncbi:MAG: peptide chain release factor N(5)-glutamine methyltransferase [Rhodoferax sp.]|nr:peptide chain release factor N(5)-glutamine methyltransferase [Rhodoferax sp.]MDP3653526.1 peptide chain release factor N(5)-glutamine methyltransferase [Rhodoferax sp.]